MRNNHGTLGHNKKRCNLADSCMCRTEYCYSLVAASWNVHTWHATFLSEGRWFEKQWIKLRCTRTYPVNWVYHRSVTVDQNSIIRHSIGVFLPYIHIYITLSLCTGLSLSFVPRGCVKFRYILRFMSRPSLQIGTKIQRSHQVHTSLRCKVLMTLNHENFWKKDMYLAVSE